MISVCSLLIKFIKKKINLIDDLNNLIKDKTKHANIRLQMFKL